ncbi:hypothetical protein N599_21745 [Saccharopolyspora erythraea D]|nr:hypothetical protein N599_21745 [Saccharopolyspora erythraea D]
MRLPDVFFGSLATLSNVQSFLSATGAQHSSKTRSQSAAGVLDTELLPVILGADTLAFS